jgi:hypothetical protein
MDAQPNLAIYPPPLKSRSPNAWRLPRWVSIGVLLRLPLGAVGWWVAEHFWLDPIPPETSPPLASEFGWDLVLVSMLVFVLASIAALVMVAASARARPALKAKSVEVAELRASRGRLVDASDAARREIERDLYDGVQPRLVALPLLSAWPARPARWTRRRP